ncbi:MAG: diguanylate cyclase [Terriglobia bacterium]
MAFTIRNLKIRDQILLVTIPPLLVLLCAVFLAFYAYRSVTTAQLLALRSRETMVRCESFLRHMTEASMAVRGFVFGRRSEVLAPYDQAITDGSADLIALSDLESADPARLHEIIRIRAEFDQMQKLWALPTIDKVRAGGELDSAEILAQGQDRTTRVRSMVLTLRDEEEAQNVNSMLGAERVIRRMLIAGVSLALLLAGILVTLTGLVARLIVVPVMQLVRASEQVGRGDLAVTLPPMLNNEFGVLSRSFSNMTNTLRREREEMASLNRYSEAVTQCTSELEVYDLLLHALKARFQPRQIIVFKLNHNEKLLEAAATLAPLPNETGSLAVIEEPQNCKAIRTGRTFVVNDVEAQPPCPSRFALPAEGSYFCGPLIASGIIIGAVRIEGAKGGWTSERRRLVESYLSGAASALSNLRLLDRMKQQANIDSLTGFYNRRFLEDYAHKLFAISRRRQQPVGFIMMDLDHFKDLNDAHGHETGDRVLRQFAKTVTAMMRETNLTARYGGEEFVVVLPDTGLRSCALVAERIRKGVMNMVVPSSVDTHLPQITVSMGVAVFPEHGQTLEEVIHAADTSLYESKRTGRNRVSLASVHDEASE